MGELPADAVVLLFAIVFLPLATGAVCLLVLWDKLGHRMGWLSKDTHPFEERRWLFYPCLALFVFFVAGFLWAWKVEPNWIEVSKLELPTQQPVLGYEKFRIVHLSDLHIEDDSARHRTIIEAVHKLQPQLIVLTGDYINDRTRADILLSMLSLLDAPHGVYAVPGDWDDKLAIQDLFQSAAQRRFPDDLRWPKLLLDDYRMIKHDGCKLLLLGQRVNAHRSLSHLLEGASPDAYRIFLNYSPDAADQIEALPSDQRLDLFLCGQTHGGQVRLPFWGAITTLSRHHKKYEMGYYQVGDTHMYVNRGVGMEGGIIPRTRFLCRPEIAVIDLVYTPD